MPPHREELDLWGCRRSHSPRPSISIPPTSVICLACRIIASHSTSGSLLPPSTGEIYHNSSVPYSRPAPPVCGPGHPSDSGGTDIQPLRWNGLPRRASSYIPIHRQSRHPTDGRRPIIPRRSISVTKSRRFPSDHTPHPCHRIHVSQSHLLRQSPIYVALFCPRHRCVATPSSFR